MVFVSSTVNLQKNFCSKKGAIPQLLKRKRSRIQMIAYFFSESKLTSALLFNKVFLYLPVLNQMY